MTTNANKAKEPKTPTAKEFVQSQARAVIKGLRKDLQRPGLNPSGKEALNTQINYWKGVAK